MLFLIIAVALYPFAIHGTAQAVDRFEKTHRVPPIDAHIKGLSSLLIWGQLGRLASGFGQSAFCFLWFSLLVYVVVPMVRFFIDEAKAAKKGEELPHLDDDDVFGDKVYWDEVNRRAATWLSPFILLTDIVIVGIASFCTAVWKKFRSISSPKCA